MFPEYSEDLFISFGSISCPSFADLNIISYLVCTRLVCLRTGECSKCLRTGCFFLTCWLKPNRTFPDGQLFVIPPQSQVLDSNSQHEADDNNHFTAKRSEKARRMGLPTKAVAICAGKKVGDYGQSNDRGSKSLPVGLN